MDRIHLIKSRTSFYNRIISSQVVLEISCITSSYTSNNSNYYWINLSNNNKPQANSIYWISYSNSNCFRAVAMTKTLLNRQTKQATSRMTISKSISRLILFRTRRLDLLLMSETSFWTLNKERIATATTTDLVLRIRVLTLIKLAAKRWMKPRVTNLLKTWEMHWHLVPSQGYHQI